MEFREAMKASKTGLITRPGFSYPIKFDEARMLWTNESGEPTDFAAGWGNRTDWTPALAPAKFPAAIESALKDPNLSSYSVPVRAIVGALCEALKIDGYEPAEKPAEEAKR